jgi:hypothetical protein
MNAANVKLAGTGERIVTSDCADDEVEYPGLGLAVKIWVAGFVILAGTLIWDLVTALLFR